MWQMAVALANRLQGSLPSNTEKNPKEQANARTLRSGRQLEPEKRKNTDVESSKGAKDSNKDEQRKPEDSRNQKMVMIDVKLCTKVYV